MKSLVLLETHKQPDEDAYDRQVGRQRNGGKTHKAVDK